MPSRQYAPSRACVEPATFNDLPAKSAELADASQELASCGSLYALDAMEAATRYNTSIVNLVLQALGSTRATAIAEFGAGTATLSRLLLSHLPWSALEAVIWVWEPFLVPKLKDASSCRVDFGRLQRLAAWSTDPVYDVVFSSNVLEHIEDDAGAVAQMVGALKPGGRVVLYVPAHERLFGPMDERCGHLRRYSKSALQALCHASGLRVVASGYSDPVGAVITALMNLSKRGVEPTFSSVGLYDRFLFPISQWLTPLTRSWFGKNVWVIAQKVGA